MQPTQSPLFNNLQVITDSRVSPGPARDVTGERTNDGNYDDEDEKIYGNEA